MTDLFHMVFSGPERQAGALVDALEAAGHPAAIDPLRAGFEAELLTSFVEALGDGDLDDPVAIARDHGYVLRMHGWIGGTASDPLLTRLDRLEQLVFTLAAAR